MIAESKEERRKRKEDTTAKPTDPIVHSNDASIDVQIKNTHSPHVFTNSQASPSNLINSYNSAKQPSSVKHSNQTKQVLALNNLAAGLAAN